MGDIPATLTRQAETTTFLTEHVELNTTATTTHVQTVDLMHETQERTELKYANKNSAFDKTKKEDVYALSKSEVRNNYSDKRADAFQGNLLFNVNLDQKLRLPSKQAPAACKAYTSMLSAIKKYAELEPSTSSRSRQTRALRNSREAIDDYLSKHRGEIPQADQVAERYKLYFATFCDGNLSVEENKPALQLDATSEKYTPEINSTGSFAIGYVDRRKDVLFPHEPSLNDVRQRFLGDCYLQGALSSLVMHNPEKLKEGIKDNGDGTVTVRFFKDYDQLTAQEKDEYRRQKMQPELRELWEKKDDFASLSDSELLFKALQGNTKEVMDSIKEQVSDAGHAVNRIYQRRMQERYRAEGKHLSSAKLREIATKTMDNTFAFINVIAESMNISKAGKTKEFCDYLVAHNAVKEQVVDNMRQLLSLEDADPAIIFQQALLRLYDMFPISAGLKEMILGSAADTSLDTPLDTPEFAERLSQYKDSAGIDYSGEKVPVYVRVTKEVPAVGKMIDAYSGDCLWVQMIEKAYAASGIHKGDDISELLEKHEEEQQKLREKLQKKNISKEEIDQQMEELKERQAEEVEQYRHSFQNIEGGFSGEFIETFTGIKAYSDHIKQTTADEAKNLIGEKYGSSIREMVEQRYGKQAITAQMNALFQYLEEKFTVEYTPKSKKKSKKKDEQPEDEQNREQQTQEQEPEKKRYYPKPIYIEDIREALLAIDSEDSFLTEAQKTIVEAAWRRSHQGEDPANFSLKEYGQTLSEIVVGLLEHDEESPFVHRPMTGKYTERAVGKYEKIKSALEHGIPVTIGTQDFLPKGVKASGLNGESVQGGLVECHAYSVVGTMEQDGHYFVRLRNPWARGEVGYVRTTTPDGSVSYSSHRKHRISNENSGIFNLELNDFLSKIDRMDFNGSLPDAPQAS